MRLKDILLLKGGPVVCTEPDSTICDAIQQLVENNIGALPVCDYQGNILGIVSERDLLKECAVNTGNIENTRVKDVMTRDIFIGFPEDRVEYIAGVMAEKGIKHLPVMAGTRLEGMVSLRDIVQAQLEHVKFRLEETKDQVLNYFDA